MVDIPIEFTPSPLTGYKLFEAPWQNAEEIQARLAKHGIPATACIEYSEKKAAIEVSADVAAEAVQAALGETNSPNA